MFFGDFVMIGGMGNVIGVSPPSIDGSVFPFDVGVDTRCNGTYEELVPSS
jgi:hypothetical protein